MITTRRLMALLLSLVGFLVIGAPNAVAAVNRGATTTTRHFVIAAEEVAGAVRAYNPANLGRSYGSRTVVEDPGIRITGFRGSSNPADPFHGLNRVIERGFSPADIMSTMRSPAAVLEQPGGRFMYLGERGAVVVRSDGQVVTAWTSNEFNATTRQILSDAMGAP
jgi:hypothetical protein